MTTCKWHCVGVQALYRVRPPRLARSSGTVPIEVSARAMRTCAKAMMSLEISECLYESDDAKNKRHDLGTRARLDALESRS